MIFTFYSNIFCVVDNINLTFLKILGEIEDNIMERFTEFQKDVNNNINTKLNDAQNKVCEVLYTSEEIKEFKTILEIPMPISDLEIFEQFDDAIEHDDRKQHALVNILLLSICIRLLLMKFKHK